MTISCPYPPIPEPAWVFYTIDSGQITRGSQIFKDIFPSYANQTIQKLLIPELNLPEFNHSIFLTQLAEHHWMIKPEVVIKGIQRWRIDSLTIGACPDQLLLFSPPSLSFYHSGPDLVYLLCPDGNPLFTVPLIHEAIAGLTQPLNPDELLSHVHPDDQERIRLEMRLALAGKHARPFPFRIQEKNNWTWYSNTTFPVHDQNERLLGYAGIARNITREMETTSSLTRRNMELVAIQELATAASGHETPGELLESFLSTLRNHYPLDAVAVCFQAENLGRSSTCLLDPDDSGIVAAWQSGELTASEMERMERITLDPPPDRMPSWQQKLAERSIHHLAIVPLHIRELGQGLLLLAACKEDTLAEFSYPFLYTLRHHLVISLENTIRLQLERRKLRYVQLLNDLSQKLLEADDHYQITDCIGQTLTKIFPDGLVILSMGYETREIDLQQTPPSATRSNFVLSDCPIPWQYSPGSTIPSEWLSSNDLPSQTVKGYGFRSSLSNGDIPGSWLLITSINDGFDQLQKDFLQNASHQLLLAAERTRLRDALREKSRIVEEKNQELQQYIYTISHDLKSPLFSIQGFVQILLEDFPELSESRPQQFLQRILNNVHRMDSQIRELLTLSRVGTRQLTCKKIHLGEMMATCLLELDVRIRARQALIQLEDLDQTVETDSDLLQRAIVNLLDNAIKYVPVEKTPTIHVSCNSCMVNNKPGLQLTIRDNGIGIATEDLEKVFLIFQRLNVIPNTEGSGAGLTIVRRTMEKLQGNVRVDSIPGTGTAFHLEIPLRLQDIP